MDERKPVNTPKKSPVLELEPLDVLNPELDYTYSIHSLYSHCSQAKCSLRSNSKQDHICPRPLRWKTTLPVKPEVTYTAGTWSKMAITPEDLRQSSNHDVLDLHRIAERYHEKLLARKTETVEISEEQRKLYKANLALAAYNDIILKEAHKKFIDVDTPITTRRKLYQLIKKMEKLPHLYNPSMREEPTNTHVKKWLLRHTGNPKEEMVGFTFLDPLEPRKFITDTEPRVSTSDTNLALGKRKRMALDDEVDDGLLKESSSDTLLLEKGDLVRPIGNKRRRVLLKR